ncbi:hypothetical protein [Pelosinus sp. UFO1]|nr:hypothetical protein [Pelosinus sp. UFO1]
MLDREVEYTVVLRQDDDGRLVGTGSFARKYSEISQLMRIFRG